MPPPKKTISPPPPPLPQHNGFCGGDRGAITEELEKADRREDEHAEKFQTPDPKTSQTP